MSPTTPSDKHEPESIPDEETVPYDIPLRGLDRPDNGPQLQTVVPKFEITAKLWDLRPNDAEG